MGELIIWWITGEQVKEIFARYEKHHHDDEDSTAFPDGLPNYIKDELRSRHGRAGRCGVWVNHKFEFQGVNWDQAKADKLFEGMNQDDIGGIVMWRHDIQRLLDFDFPNLFTDKDLNKIEVI